MVCHISAVVSTISPNLPLKREAFSFTNRESCSSFFVRIKGFDRASPVSLIFTIHPNPPLIRRACYALRHQHSLWGIWGEMSSYGDYPFIPISPYQYPLILYYVIPSVVEGSPRSPHIVSVSF